MAESSHFIAGIYNYCDSWCQKCPLSERCLVFAARAGGMDPADLDAPIGARALQFLRGRLTNALKFLRWITGGPASQTSRSEPPTQTGTSRRCATSGGTRGPHSTASALAPAAAEVTRASLEPLVLAAHVYGAMVDSWLEDSLPRLRHLRQGWPATILASARPGRVLSDAQRLVEALETIDRDRSVIPAKLSRAMAAGARRDGDGSAKVALISIDRSFAAWETIRALHREDDAASLPLLAHLDRLRRETEARFPDARAFVRPGFDALPDAAIARAHEPHPRRTSRPS